MDEFLNVLKGQSHFCQLIFMTGVTRFNLSSLGSGANMFRNISLHEDFAGIAGYRKEDIAYLFKNSFRDTIIKLQGKKGVHYNEENMMGDIANYYNGYKFSEEGMAMYNPTSILAFFDNAAFNNYWYETGNPSILLQQMRKDIRRFDQDWDIERYRCKNVMDSLDQENIDILPLMYQTGYLTLDTWDSKQEEYLLRFPNKEVKESLLTNIIKEFISKEQKERGEKASTEVKKTLAEEKWADFLNIIRIDCFSSSSYTFITKEERTFQGNMQFFLLGAFSSGAYRWSIKTEEQVGGGRIDLLIEDPANRTVYILEFKMNKSGEEALRQIIDKNYMEKYVNSYDRIVCMGMNFVFNDTKGRHHRNINEASVLVSDRGMDDTHHFNIDNAQKFVFDLIQKKFHTA